MKRSTVVLSALLVLCLAPAALSQTFPLPPSADLSLSDCGTKEPVHFTFRGTAAFDDFNRPNNSSMGSDWAEMAGDIDILNDQAANTSGTNSWMLHTSGADNYDTTIIEFDVDPNTGGYSCYLAAVIGYDPTTGEDIYVKIQNQSGLAGYSNYGFYHGFNGSGYGSWGGFGSFPTQINAGHVIVYIDNGGDRVNMDIDDYPPDGVIDHHYEAPGLIASGLPALLGQGTGAGFWADGIMDNWALNGGASNPTVDIKCNGGDTGVQVPAGINVKIDFDIEAGLAVGTPVDIWLVLLSPFGPFSYNGTGPIAGWNVGLGFAYYTGPFLDVNGTCLDRPVPVGSYKANVGIDTIPNGSLDLGSIPLRDKVDFLVF